MLPYNFDKDPIGYAIHDYTNNLDIENIIVCSDFMEDDVIPTSYLFRTNEEFPLLEQKAMELCYGKILDIGAAAGPHSHYLIANGKNVSTLEVSPNAHRYLKKRFPDAQHFLGNIHNLTTSKFDTLLLLMNGIGIAGTRKKTTKFLQHLAQLLNPGGQILCDSTDIKYLFKNKDGSYWMDVSVEYYGDFKFNMRYKTKESGWFDWVYFDLESLRDCANNAGLTLSLCATDEDSFLVKLLKT